MKINDTVEIMNFNGSRWQWSKTYGIIKNIDKYCFTVEVNNKEIRDVFNHFRQVK